MEQDSNGAVLLAWREWLAQRHPLVQRILVTGSRTWTRVTLIRLALTVPGLSQTATVVEGDAVGADRLAGQVWGGWLGRPVEAHPLPEGWWRQRGGRSIPLARDQHMVDLGADVCLAFIRANSSGATKTAGMAERAGIRVFRFRQEA